MNEGRDSDLFSHSLLHVALLDSKISGIDIFGSPAAQVRYLVREYSLLNFPEVE